MSVFVLALDQGTTSSRALLFDQHGVVVGEDQYEFTQHFPQPGWVEHDPRDLLDGGRRLRPGGRAVELGHLADADAGGRAGWGRAAAGL